MKISLEQAAKRLNSGHVIGVPTETVYGLAASIKFPEAIADIFRLKGRPANNPLIVHLACFEEIIVYAKQLPAHFQILAKAFWPGPLTLVLPVREHQIPSAATAGLSTAAFRIPDHNLTRTLLKATGPLVMPSANLSGKPSSTSATHVENDFGHDFSVLDGGECVKGVESTILYWDGLAWIVIRLGAIAPEDFLPFLGYTPKISEPTKSDQAIPLCPGQLYRHYSPKAKLLLCNKISNDLQGAIVGFSNRSYPKNCRLFILGNSQDPHCAAHELYAILRKLDSENIEQAFVDMDFPNYGLWLTLKERLQKAANP